MVETRSLRTLFDLHKDFRPNLEMEVQPFLDFVVEIYQGFKETVTHFFGPGSALALANGEMQVSCLAGLTAHWLG